MGGNMEIHRRPNDRKDLVWLPKCMLKVRAFIQHRVWVSPCQQAPPVLLACCTPMQRASPHLGDQSLLSQWEMECTDQCQEDQTINHQVCPTPGPIWFYASVVVSSQLGHRTRGLRACPVWPGPYFASRNLSPTSEPWTHGGNFSCFLPPRRTLWWGKFGKH